MEKIAGLHLLIDGYVRDGKTLNPDTICTLFDNLVETLHMQYLQPPTAVRVPFDPKKINTPEDEGGWSVICQITTSHISLHSWPMRGAFMMDIFSCCDFDAKAAQKQIVEGLDVVESKVQVIHRQDPRH
ncbi:MAG: S-adenosylmethionine decarboxylase [Pseudomonadota bacterium]